MTPCPGSIARALSSCTVTSLRLRSAAALCCLVLVPGVAACGGKDKPAVCSDVDSLKTSIGNVKDVQIGQGALGKIGDSLDQVKQDLSKLKTDAKQQYGSQLDQVQQALDSVSSSLTTAKNSPSVTSLTGVAAAVSSVVSGLESLEKAVSSTC
jgi:hypothetical protein